jgi:hypothetical protein
MPLVSIIYEMSLSGGAGRVKRPQTPAFKTAENRRQETLDSTAPQGPAKKTAGRATKNLSKVPTGTEVSGPGLLIEEATPAKTAAAPASPDATQLGHQARIAAASLAKAARQRDDEEGMMIMLLANSPQSNFGSALLRAFSGDDHANR